MGLRDHVRNKEQKEVSVKCGWFQRDGHRSHTRWERMKRSHAVQTGLERWERHLNRKYAQGGQGCRTR